MSTLHDQQHPCPECGATLATTRSLSRHHTTMHSPVGARQKDLAQQFGISDGQVSMIVRGQRWAAAGGPIERNTAHG